jgi:hypothetical protein
MSSFLVSDNSIKEMAQFIYYVYHYSYEFTGIYIDDRKVKEAIEEACKPYATDYVKREFNSITEDTLFSALKNMNLTALKARYPEDDYTNELLKSTGNYSTWKQAEYKEGRYIVPDSRYQLAKSIQCYLYQCNEDDISESKFYKAIEAIQVKLSQFILENTEQYSKAQWR